MAEYENANSMHVRVCQPILSRSVLSAIMYTLKNKRVVFALFVSTLCLGSTTATGDWGDDGDYDIFTDLRQNGFTMVNKSLKQKSARLPVSYAFSAKSRHAHNLEVADDTILVPEQPLNRYKRQTEDESVYSGDDPCETNTTLCSGMGQECQFAHDNSDGFLCVCKADFETQAIGSCSAVPETKKLYLTVTMDHPFSADFANSSSGAFLLSQTEVEATLSDEFIKLAGYKALKVLEFRNNTGFTQAVFSLIFTTDVLPTMKFEVATTVIGIESGDFKVNITGAETKLQGLFGIFKGHHDTYQTALDAVDWCIDASLNDCSGKNRECKDAGVDPRFTCLCTNGFESASLQNSHDCEDVDECTTNKGGCDHGCKNLNGSFVCECYSGYMLDADGKSCNKDKEAPYDLFSFAGHDKMKRSDDDTHRIDIASGFPVAESLEYKLFIGVNGLISFGQANRGLEYRLDDQKKMLCPYLSDINTLTVDNIGDIYYKVYSNRRENETMFNIVDSMIKEFVQADEYNTKLVIMVTWDKVAHYSSTNPKTETATFQTLLISDGRKSYALVTYQQNSIKWVYKPDTPLIIGMSRGDGTRPKAQLVSNTPQAFSGLDQIQGNTGHRGMWLYEMGEAYSADLDCDDWYQRELPRQRELSDVFNSMPACPCTTLGLSHSWSKSHNPEHPTLDCYRLTQAASFFYKPHNKECCYQQEQRTTGSFVQDLPFAGSLLANWATPGGDRNDNYHWHDVCCYKALSIGSCTKYYDLRPIGNCTGTVDFGVSVTVGDPHIKTLDGKDYTFNGWGEYTLVSIHNSSFNFTLQGRTELATNTKGDPINATVFTAFVASEGGVVVQVELQAGDKESMIIQLASGGEIRDYTLQFNENIDFALEDVTHTLQRSNRSLVVAFPSGISIILSTGFQLLDITVRLPKVFLGQSKGLMGNFNNNASDDFMLPDGTLLPPDMNETRIFNDFGKAWATKADESVFLYDEEQQKSHSSYQHPNFQPVFLDEASPTQMQDAKTRCGGENNIACIYDYIATGNQLLAEATRNAKDNADKHDVLLKNTAPTIKGNKTITVRPGQSVIFELEGEDAEDSQVTYMQSESSQGLIHLNQTTGKVTYDVGLTPNKSDSLVFYAVDRLGAPSQVLSCIIQYCPHCGHGHCNLEQPRADHSSDTFQVATCECDQGYAGEDCQQEYDACGESPCIQGQECVNIPVAKRVDTTVAYKCGPCPRGFEAKDDKCSDVDECSNNTLHLCEQLCNNTEGSYSCSCRLGYRLAEDSRSCTDINECVEKTSQCQQLCNNTEGSYTCGCHEGYYSVSSTHCQQNATTLASCNSLGCAQGCSMVNGSVPQCFCNPGYNVDPANSTLCVDVDECTTNNMCMQNCSNSVGSFSCSCYAGFLLDVDHRTCQRCPPLQYGVECNKTCQCNGRSESCDPSTGCLCTSGWRGENCELDVDECTENPSVCGDGLQSCVNLQGSYRCDCLPGYAKAAPGANCTDINECALDGRCHDLEECRNTVGNYSCVCRAGYTRVNGSSACININECETGSAGCEQACTDNQGSYVCSCRFGFRLKADRKTCEEGENVCRSSNLNCTHLCTLKIQGDPYCFCRSGYVLQKDNRTCKDTDECQDGTHKCSGGQCRNTNGSYVCSCPGGSFLDNDGRTCLACLPGTYGVNCSLPCECGQGSTGCDPVTGCVCRSGWTGNKCNVDIDECSDDAKKDCNKINASCKDFPGNFRCICDKGFAKNDSDQTSVCKDIDECASNPCGQICNNTIGSYVCSCHEGYAYNHTIQQCQDIDECALSATNRCKGRCINTEGKYRCACDLHVGLVLNDDGYSCRECREWYYGDCSQPCTCNQTHTVACDKRNGSCSCSAGWRGKDCKDDVDECTENLHNCSTEQNQVCINTDGGFRCVCADTGDIVSVNVKCMAPNRISFEIRINISYPDLEDVLKANTSIAYTNLRTELELSLFAQMNTTVEGLLRVIVTSMRFGSLSANVKVETRPDVANSALSAAKFIAKLHNFNLTVGEHNGKIIDVTVQGKQVQGTCDVVGACLNGQVCQEDASSGSVCLEKPTTGESGDKLVIGLSVGIPLAAVVLIAVVAIVCIRVRAGRRKRRNMDEHRQQLTSVFAQTIAPRGSWGHSFGILAPYHTADSISKASGDNDDDDQQRSGARKSPRQASEFESSPWADRGTTHFKPPSEPTALSNFSWDFMFNQLGEGDFTIQRPKVEPKPNSTFQNFGANSNL